MIVFPNAKINIGLNIVEKRPDGFHNIESCFYPIGWSDALEIMRSEVFSFQSAGIDIPGGGENNLCTKAYQMLAEDYDFEPISIQLLKAIPIGAGLGGGSADAAFTIRAIDELFTLGISVEDQMNYARRLGSDCAFFIENKPVYCFGKGDQFEQIKLSLQGKYIVLINPGLHISTVEAYAGVIPERPLNDLRKSLDLPVSEWKDLVENDFEKSLFPKYPVLPALKTQLYDAGASYASMTGSGSTVYGIFDDEVDLSGTFGTMKMWQGGLN